MNEFEKIFEKLAKTDDASIIWTNWLDWVIDSNLIINHNRQLNFKGNEQAYFELYCAWLDIVNHELETTDKPYYDYLGVFYEDIIQSKYKAGDRGQFFTPQEVSKLISGINITSDGGMINDCACGSGRLLLDARANNPTAILIGQDLDPVACKMAVLNLYVSGARGSIIRQDTLTLEFFEAYRVNNYLGYGMCIPHIELVNEREAYNFIGLRNNGPGQDDHVIGNNDEDVVEEVVEKVTLDYKPKGTGQTTLM